MASNRTVILGAGMTGLAAAWASGLPLYEAEEAPGGICSSYYLPPGGNNRLQVAPNDDDAFRFELGGGHWIFGGDSLVMQFIGSLAPLKRYKRRSSVFFPDRKLFVPYPIQNNLRYLEADTMQKALCEMSKPGGSRRFRTMAEWLEGSFGPTLCEMFFGPFHDLYTAGLWRLIAPQDAYKSPVDLGSVIAGAFSDAPSAGYNTSFVYPTEGLDTLTRRMAAGTDIRYGKRVVGIDVQKREVFFADGSGVCYEQLLSTLPLNRMLRLTGIDLDVPPDPSPSVLVVNIGARRGPECPEDHWVYVPTSNCNFHRVGFYSNVDSSFLPVSVRNTGEYVSVYVEKAFAEGQKPSTSEIENTSKLVVEQLRRWGWIGEVAAVDPTWIDVAYTWSWPGSNWKQLATRTLEERCIHQVGRYARWVFQGIADSIRDGLLAGAALTGRASRVQREPKTIKQAAFVETV